MAEREKKKKGNFFTYNNNNGIQSVNKQNHYNVEENDCDWQHRIERLRDKPF